MTQIFCTLNVRGENECVQNWESTTGRMNVHSWESTMGKMNVHSWECTMGRMNVLELLLWGSPLLIDHSLQTYSTYSCAHNTFWPHYCCK